MIGGGVIGGGVIGGDQGVIRGDWGRLGVMFEQP